jgi:hypothetical protein
MVLYSYNFKYVRKLKWDGPPLFWHAPKKEKGRESCCSSKERWEYQAAQPPPVSPSTPTVK